MQQDFSDIFVFSITIQDALSNLMVALLCGVFIAVLYRVTYRGLSYSANFVNAIIMLSMITALVIMVIGNNLARAFGLVGAMSIIRFRTAVKDTQDIMFIFFALGIGLAAGAGTYAICVVGTLFISAAVFITSKINHAKPTNKEFLLQIQAHTETLPTNAFDAILENHCSTFKLINVKSVGATDNQHIENSFYIQLNDRKASDLLVRELKNVAGVQRVNVFMDEN
ncbi:MAG: DUF4956 domain-containing protein [Flavobacteriales bacterium]|nr:MAG: DUF4956 domain-containing protein [Flavobacteriales bacterium]